MKMVGCLVLMSILGLLCGCDRSNKYSPKEKIAWLNLCPDFAATGKTVVTQSAECGNFLVKENPQNNSSRLISLNILRLPAINPMSQQDPLFIIAGGPGQSAVALAESFHQAFSDVRKNRDFIFLDQRGTGKSSPLNCEIESAKADEHSPVQQKVLLREAIQKCIEMHRDHAPYYTTNYAVADLDMIREAMGYKKINLWGGSYGSRVVLEYLRRYPTQARSGVIDGVAPVDIALPWFMERDVLAALTAINQQCVQAVECNRLYGDILQKAKEASELLHKTPVKVSIPHPRTQEQLVVSVDAESFASVIQLALYSRDLSTLLPQMIHNAFVGDYQLVASLMNLAKAKNEAMKISYGMHYAVVCNEDYPLYKDKKAEESNVFLHAHSVQKYSEVCSQWPTAKLPSDYWQPFKSEIPVLILSGEVDPVTPPAWGALAKKSLKNATEIIAPGGHHIVTQEGCITQLIAAFIERGDGQQLNSSCVKNIKPLAIWLPPAKAEASSHEQQD